MGGHGESLSGRARRSAWSLAALVAALAPAGAGILGGAAGPLAIEFDLGPNDGAYLDGFAPVYEIDPDGRSTHWTTHAASVSLPIEVSGGAVELEWSGARVLAQTAVVDVEVDGRPVDRFECRGGGYQTRSVRLGGLPPRTPLRVGWRADSHDRRERGLRLDWLRWKLGAGARAWMSAPAAWLCLGLLASLFLAFRIGGMSAAAAAALVVPWSLALAWWSRSDPFALAHVAGRAAVPGAALVLASGWAWRGRPGGSWLAPILAAGYLLKAALVFHPAFFYPDAMNHRRYVFAMERAEGGVVERGRAAQVAVGTAYPRIVAGRAYAFPYSPLYFVPFTWLPPDAARVEDALRQSALLAAAGEVVLVFVLGRVLFGPGVGALAALLAAFLPGMYSRLLLAMWPTVVGHLADVGVVCAAFALAAVPASRARLLALLVTLQAAWLAYISSLFNLGAFLVAWSGLDRRIAARALGAGALAGLVTVASLYAHFTGTFVAEILPALAAGRSGGTGTGTAVWATLSRLPDFFGYGYPALALAGLVLARRRLDPHRFAVLAAWGLAYLALLGLRAFGAGLFKDLKEVLFVGPWVALLTAVTLDEIATRVPRGRLAVGLVVTGLVVFGVARGTRTFFERVRRPGEVTQITSGRTARDESATLPPVSPRWPILSPSS